jgi:transposase
VGHHTEAYVGIDTSKSCNAIAIADGGRGGEVRYLGDFPATRPRTSRQGPVFVFRDPS